MKRVSKLLVLSIVIALIAAPSAFGKALQPPLPPDARAAQGASDPGEAPALIVGGVAVMLGAAVLLAASRRRPAAALQRG